MRNPAGPAFVPLPGALPGLQPGRVREILLHPHPALRLVARPAGELIWPEITALSADLLATMYAAAGRGLAAPQTGVSRRVFVMDAGWKRGVAEPLLLLDPQILSRSDLTETAEERCLSIPDLPVMMTRPVEIGIAFYGLDGVRRTLALTGDAARIAQHEADHLDGRLIVDAP